MKVIFEEYGLLILGALAIVVLVFLIYLFRDPIGSAVQGLISQFSNNVHIQSFGPQKAVRPRKNHYYVAYTIIERLNE